MQPPDPNIFRFGYGHGEYLTPKQAALMEAWGTSLKRFPWAWYVHLTFKYDVSINAAERKFREWLRLMNRRRKRTVGCFALVHLHTNREVYHIHLLMLGVGNLQRRTWDRKWFPGWSRIAPYEEHKKGTYYLAKKVATGEAENYFFGGSLKDTDTAKRIMREMDARSNK